MTEHGEVYQCLENYGSIKSGSFWRIEKLVKDGNGKPISTILVRDNAQGNAWFFAPVDILKTHFMKVSGGEVTE